MTNENLYAYVRVSSAFQKEDRQVIAMREFGVTETNIMVEKLSGKDFNRPVYWELMGKLRAGDIMVIKSIDRLGRNYEEIIEQWRNITKEMKAQIVVLDMPLLDTRAKGRDLTGAFVADLVLQILSYVAETERIFLRRRQAEGIMAARERGVQFGRPRRDLPDDFGLLVKLWEGNEISFWEALKRSGLKRSTFYRRLKDYRRP